MTESERIQYNKQIYKRRYEKELLSLELQTHLQEQQDIELAARALTDRLKIAGNRQKDILNTLENTFKKPAQNLDPNDRKRRLLAQFNNDQECFFDVKISETLTIDTILALDVELVEQLESSVKFWEDILTEYNQKWTPESDHEPPMDLEMSSKDTEIGTNSEPFKTVVSNEEERESGDMENVQVGVNDGFWEQFLTESPSGSMADNEQKGFDQYGKFWWNMKSVNSFAERT